MKFIWKYIRNKISNLDDCEKLSRAVAMPDRIEHDQGLNITVLQAIGGKIVTFRHYDSQKDRSYWKTYIVPEDMDFERELGKMITLESMR